MYPILFQLGPVPIYSYGFFLALAFLVGTFVIWKEGRKKNFDEEKVLDFILISILGGLLVGRILFVGFNWELFATNLTAIVLFWNIPGFYGLGIVVGSLISGVLYLRKQRWPIFDVYNITVIGLLLAQVFERIGFFLSTVSQGKITTSFLGLQYPGQTVKVHPLALYEAVLYLVAFIALYFFHIKRSGAEGKSQGVCINLYLLIIAVIQIGLGFLRESKAYLGSVDLTFIWPLTIILFDGVILYLRGERDISRDFSFVSSFITSRLGKGKNEPEGKMDELISNTKQLKRKDQ